MDKVFLAHIVTFDMPNITLSDGMIDMPFASEEYRLVVAFSSWAYDLQDEGCRYHIIEMYDDEYMPDYEVNNLKPHTKYVYDMTPFTNVWDSVSAVFQIPAPMETYLQDKIERAQLLHFQLGDEDSENVINFAQAKKILKGGKK